MQKDVLCLRVYELMRLLEQLRKGEMKSKQRRERLHSQSTLQYLLARQLVESCVQL
jgi:hypothetical protein